ncbi:MAG: fumarate reductase/succinate dehydrogenase flavoprotein subunit, partial [Bacteroidota bacterium]|nr:fumarate reductase/succinate dehydrogenase flavoprotein subunit [Bacteroidota bacterium]
LMQGLADGYFVLPYTIQEYLADQFNVEKISTDTSEFKDAEKAVKDHVDKLMNVKGKKSVDTLHRELGKIMWKYVGMAREGKELEKAISELKELKKEFWQNVEVPGVVDGINVELEKANRVADFIELGLLMAQDALNREESCGGHYRLEYQTPEGEALRKDDEFMYVAVWEYKGEDQDPELHKEQLVFEETEVKTRNYKTA